MSLIVQTAGGYADGANVDLPNAGETPFVEVVPGSGTITAVASTIKGTRAYRFAPGSDATACYVRTSIPVASFDNAKHFYLDTTGGPPNIARIIAQYGSSSGATMLAGLAWRPDRKLQVNDLNGISAGVAASPLPAGIWRVEFLLHNGTGTADTFKVHVYAADSLTRSTAYDLEATGNFGTSAPGSYTIGKKSTAATVLPPFLVADIREQQSTTTEIGATAGASPTVADAGAAAIFEPWATATLSGTDTAGGPYSWTQINGPAVTLTGTGATRTYTVPATLAGAQLTFSFAGGSPAATVTHTALPAVLRGSAGGVEVPVRFQLAVGP